MKNARKLSIVDYRVGNISSLVHAFEKLGANCEVVSTPQEIIRSYSLVLPGVGSFSSAARQLRHLGLSEALHEANEKFQLPILGICLGMHLLGEKSAEGGGQGLHLIKGDTARMTVEYDRMLRIPHLGWNSLVVSDTCSPLLQGISDDDEFYFCHSYYFNPSDQHIIMAKSNYGMDFASLVMSKNIVGVQFHPEKSGIPGKKLLLNFLSHI